MTFSIRGVHGKGVEIADQKFGPNLPRKITIPQQCNSMNFFHGSASIASWKLCYFNTVISIFCV